MDIKRILLFQILTHSVFSQFRRLDCPFGPYKLGNNDTDPYHIEIVKIGEGIEIPCCQRFNTTRLQKVWYKRNRFFSDNEITLKPLLHSVDYLFFMHEGQAGIYYCKDLGIPGYVNTYFYILDAEYPNATVIRGGFDVYASYMESHIDTINSYLSQPNNTEMIAFNLHTGIKLQAIIRWEPWTACDYCKGEKVRKGRCHLQPQMVRAHPCDLLCQIHTNALNMDCQSHWTVREMFPLLAERVKNVPHFEGVVKCVGPCSADITSGIDYTKKLRTRLLLVGRSAILACPGHTRLNKCFWRRDGIKLTPDEYDAAKKVNVNEFCLLHLSDVTLAEAGNYTCYVNDQMIQQNKVVVDEMYQARQASLYRHIMYLLYIILLCFVVLVGGIAVACLQRQNFKKLNEDEIIEMYAAQRFEHERLLPEFMNVSKDD